MIKCIYKGIGAIYSMDTDVGILGFEYGPKGSILYKTRCKFGIAVSLTYEYF
jgi:hypothetical protein